MLLRKTIRRRRLRRLHFIPFLLLFAEILDRAPYRKNACVFESGFLLRRNEVVFLESGIGYRLETFEVVLTGLNFPVHFSISCTQLVLLRSSFPAHRHPECSPHSKRSHFEYTIFSQLHSIARLASKRR